MSDYLTRKQFEYLMQEVYKLNHIEACIRFRQPQLIDDFVRRSDVVRLLQKMQSEAKKEK